jgi:hypothetical protein
MDRTILLMVDPPSVPDIISGSPRRADWQSVDVVLLAHCRLSTFGSLWGSISRCHVLVLDRRLLSNELS